MQIFIEFVIGSFLMISLSPDDYDLKMTRVLRELRGCHMSRMSRGHNCHLVSLIISHHPLMTDIANLWPAPSRSIFPVSQDAGFIPAARVLSSLTKLSLSGVQQLINQRLTMASTLWLLRQLGHSDPSRHYERTPRDNIGPGSSRGHQSHKRLKGSVYKDSALIEHEDNLYL